MTTWTTTLPDAELPFACDRCGKPADTVHFVPWVTTCEEVLFACPGHDAGGYWVRLAELFRKPERWADHIGRKRGGATALALLDARLYALRQDAA